MNFLNYFLSDHFTFTKRQLGVLLFVGGVVGCLGMLLLDSLGGGREGGIGPAQRIAIVLMALTALFGLTLIPLGKTPA
jgi:predicted MFS family arabinose efflux permease